jgi:hypothetical protein
MAELDMRDHLANTERAVSTPESAALAERPYQGCLAAP